VGLLPLACWDCGFESQRGHGCLSVVFVLSNRYLCVWLITRPEESYWLCACLIVGSKPLERGALGPGWGVAPQERNRGGGGEFGIMYCWYPKLYVLQNRVTFNSCIFFMLIFHFPAYKMKGACKGLYFYCHFYYS
jgi:hypothetical protein